MPVQGSSYIVTHQDHIGMSANQRTKMTEAPNQSWSSHEREFCIYADTFIKQSFRPSEYVKNIHGDPVVPSQGRERLKNEAACLEFILKNTDIPVPKVLEAYEDNGSFVLVTELVTGRVINDLQLEDQAIVIKEVESHLGTSPFSPFKSPRWSDWNYMSSTSDCEGLSSRPYLDTNKGFGG